MSNVHSKEDYENWPDANYEEFILPTGHWVILDAFFESKKKTIEPKFTLRIREHNGIPSAYQIILHSSSEHDAAMKLCGDWAIWTRWKKSRAVWEGRFGTYTGTGLRDGVEAMEVRIASEALKEVIARSKGGDYRASKDLVTWGITKKKTGKKVENIPDDAEDNVIDIAEGLEVVR